jgi:hypothetical protein
MKMGLNRLGLLFALLLVTVVEALAQTKVASRAGEQPTARADTENENLRSFVTKHDLSRLWTTAKSSDIYGFIGADYQRLRIHFLSVSKDQKNPTHYLVMGKTLARNILCNFQGTIVVETVRQFTSARTLTSG